MAISAGARRPLAYVLAATSRNAIASAGKPLSTAKMPPSCANTAFMPTSCKRDVRHGRDRAGECDRDFERTVAEAVAHEIGSGNVAALARDAPKAHQHDEHDGIGDGFNGHGKEPERSDSIDERRNGDERVGGIDIAADQKPAK